MRVKRKNGLSQEAVELEMVSTAESIIHFVERNPCYASVKNTFFPN